MSYNRVPHPPTVPVFGPEQRAGVSYEDFQSNPPLSITSQTSKIASITDQTKKGTPRRLELSLNDICDNFPPSVKRPPDNDINLGPPDSGKGPFYRPFDIDFNLSCPFRKRNPLRFNVRDHQSCAIQPFPDISQLKRHVKNFHKLLISLYACPRCKNDMKTREAYKDHVSLPSKDMCRPVEEIPPDSLEDGITSKVEDLLNGRKINTKIDTWHVLWMTLFPGDSVVPSPDFVPPVESQEVFHDLEEGWDGLEEGIKRVAGDLPLTGALQDELAERMGQLFKHYTQFIKMGLQREPKRTGAYCGLGTQ
ncbi:hypothetical protein B0T24DRAFT_600456 [Lasiosphaeria ovina]|uniref:C2H2-type domain-containing protein n=1 Tax=Lasiosphaeria ovina TaxID=92902 RepID=A0AAE0TWJ6_9PEZI|nr:hypothetical protein B0T24DRAFT_600456 [Lasiosphaeria ovina]